MGRFVVVFMAALALHHAWVAVSANASQSHSHRGLIPRFSMDGLPSINLTKHDIDQIEAGKLWKQAHEIEGVGRGIIIKDIAAPIDIVFEQISDFTGYVGKIPLLKSLNVYSHVDNEFEVVKKAAYVVKVIPGFNLEYFVEHHVSKKKRTIIFCLDYDRLSDFNDLQGKWYLEEHPQKHGWTRIYYWCDVMLFGHAPRFVSALLASTGLVTSVGWVKRESEKQVPKSALHHDFVGYKPIRRALFAWSGPMHNFVLFFTPEASTIQRTGCHLSRRMATAVFAAAFVALRQRSLRAKFNCRVWLPFQL